MGFEAGRLADIEQLPTVQENSRGKRAELRPGIKDPDHSTRHFNAPILYSCMCALVADSVSMTVLRVCKQPIMA